MSTPIPKPLRTQLESTIQNARTIAESAVQTELGRLGVDQPNAPDYLDTGERTLRNQLRAHQRSLGSADRLRQEVAYEQWHRMLFARFLAESSLLIHPEHDVAVTLADCAELAKETGARSPWVLAGQFASAILPQVFRADSPSLALHLSRENEKQLETLLEALPTEVFLADDSLGWVYQFWQSKTKDEVNKSEKKIGADELSAVTQLFTEPYMVSFLIDNTLGAWWAVQTLTEADWTGAADEATLRSRTAVPGLSWDYLRFVNEEGRWRPASGTFGHWPKDLNALKILDPCCGSGHFLTALLAKLVPLYRAQGLSAAQAVDAVLAQNLHGLELDRRCVELAAFALAFSAWRIGGGYRPLPELQVAWVGQKPSGSADDWAKLAPREPDVQRALRDLNAQFRLAPVLGSLIEPLGDTSIFAQASRADVAAILNKPFSDRSDDEREATVSAQGLQKAAALLAGQYTWAVTNVPYLALGKQETTLAEYCKSTFPDFCADIATSFVDRCLRFGPRVTLSVVSPQNWLYQDAYKVTRRRLLKETQIKLLARLGANAFEEVSGEVVKAQLVVLTRGSPAASGLAPGSNPESMFSAIALDNHNDPELKAQYLISGDLIRLQQGLQLENRHARIQIANEGELDLLNRFSEFHNGICTGDYARFGRVFWEIRNFGGRWVFQQTTVDQTSEYSGLTNLLDWESGTGSLHSFVTERLDGNIASWIRGVDIWGQRGVLVSAMSDLKVSLYSGEAFDDNCVAITPRSVDDLLPIWTFMSSPSFNEEVRKVSQSLKVRGPLIDIPFDLDHWTQVAQERYPNGLPQPYSDDPTQWIFHGHPQPSTAPLQVALARLVGYRWPAETDAEMKLSAEARAWIAKTANLDGHVDDDGIVCLGAVHQEAPAAERLRALLRDAFGPGYDEEKLLADAGYPGYSLAAYLCDKAFEDHCKRFGHRPFVWHITDGHRDGFSAFVNYHRLDAAGLDRLIYSYLGDHIHRLESAGSTITDADTKLVHAKRLKERLERIKEGEAPYDIFVRWKALKDQPLGWNPDLNDGVRMNIRPFMTAELLKVNKPPKLNIKWDKDRGKDVASAPWFGVHGGDRINDWHTTLSEKRGARNV